MRSLTLALCLMPACNAKLVEELPARASHSAAEQNGATLASAGSAALPPAPGAPGERPSLLQNMGRGFQGKLAMRLQSSKGPPYDLLYLSLGNTARLQIDSVEQAQPATHAVHLDALIWGESVSLLDHQQRSVRTFPLRQIRPSEEPSRTVDTKKTSARTSIQGVFCEAYQFQEGPIRVDACVGGLPGDFDVDRFETMSGIDVPAWAEQLLQQQLLPLRAVAHDAGEHELYRLELVEYSPGPVDRALLSVPTNYQPVASNSSAAPSRAMPVGSAPGGQP
ncbi:MAG: DUF4412 domain-containing protein [Deltaproteobacteria bacterium]